MRQTFDANTPREVALSRARDSRKVGRKHNHQPRGRALEKRLGSPRRRQLRDIALRKKLSLKIAAYFRGELECFPNG